jgi:Na+-transporting NADH:ubiquinone oxidoreductase subunit NqrD
VLLASFSALLFLDLFAVLGRLSALAVFATLDTAFASSLATSFSTATASRRAVVVVVGSNKEVIMAWDVVINLWMVKVVITDFIGAREPC